MGDLVRLIAPPGTDECNYGTERYPVHDDGTVMVPEEAVSSLVGVGGFARVRDAAGDDRSGETVPVRGPAGCDAVSWSGVTYALDGQGLFRVPVEAACDLVAHGFAVATEG